MRRLKSWANYGEPLIIAEDYATTFNNLNFKCKLDRSIWSTPWDHFDECDLIIDVCSIPFGYKFDNPQVIDRAIYVLLELSKLKDWSELNE